MASSKELHVRIAQIDLTMLSALNYMHNIAEERKGLVNRLQKSWGEEVPHRWEEYVNNIEIKKKE